MVMLQPILHHRVRLRAQVTNLQPQPRPRPTNQGTETIKSRKTMAVYFIRHPMDKRPCPCAKMFAGTQSLTKSPLAIQAQPHVYHSFLMEPQTLR